MKDPLSAFLGGIAKVGHRAIARGLESVFLDAHGIVKEADRRIKRARKRLTEMQARPADEGENEDEPTDSD